MAGGVETYFLEKSFKNLIISSVNREEKSISRLARELEKEGHKIHRLYLTGYLKALADLGILREKAIPPSKVYTTSSSSDKNIYESIGDRCKVLDIPNTERTRAAAYTLQRLFKRPIFLSEIKMCGLDGVVVGSMAQPDERTDIRNHLVKTGLKIPSDDPAYIVEDQYANEFEAITTALLLEKFDAVPLIVETRQIRLDDVHQAGKGKARIQRKRGR